MEIRNRQQGSPNKLTTSIQQPCLPPRIQTIPKMARTDVLVEEEEAEAEEEDVEEGKSKAEAEAEEEEPNSKPEAGVGEEETSNKTACKYLQTAFYR